MKMGGIIGLSLLVGGIIVLILYGLYWMFRAMLLGIDPILFIAIVAIFLGAVILLISTALERRKEDLKEIKKEDLKP
jgi:RsiW-degrading membrane proteinase PrsW (M82 family)